MKRMIVPQWVLLLLDELREQHAVDLAVYRSAHTHVANIRLHDVFIPCEVASLLWLFTTIVLGYNNHNNNKSNNSNNNKGVGTKGKEWQLLVITSLGWTLGLVSCVVAADLRLGLTVFLFHILVVQICQRCVAALGFTQSLRWGAFVWTASWGLQIGVGHYAVEGTPPNLFNADDQVSLLSTLTSIVLAWEC